MKMKVENFRMAIVIISLNTLSLENLGKYAAAVATSAALKMRLKDTNNGD